MPIILRSLASNMLDLLKMLANICENRARLQTTLFFFLGASCAFGQITLSLASASAVKGGTASLSLSMNAVSNQPADLQWTFSYPATDLTSVSVVAGPAAVAAGKTIACNGGSGSYSCMLFGPQSSTIAGGVVATATFTVSPTTVSPSSTIQVINGLGATLNDLPLSVTATGGQVAIAPPPTVTKLACTPATVITPGAAACTVSVSAPAPTGGLSVATGVVGGSASVTIPPSVLVSAGSTTAGFTGNAAAVSATTTAVLVTSLNGTSQNFSLTLAPPASLTASTLTALTCSPNTLVSRSSTTCTVMLANPAPTGGVTVALKVSTTKLTVPPSVVIPAGSASAQFAVKVGNLNATQTAAVLASLNGNSVTFSLSLSAKNH
jgi:hypothetical protein